MIPEEFSIFCDCTNYCNLDCVYCPRTNHEPVALSPSGFARILHELGGKARSLSLGCAWECTISPHFIEIITLLGHSSIPFTSILTHGNNLDDEKLRTIIESGINNVAFSLSEIDKKTYERIRKNGDFDAVTGNIKRLRDLKKEMQSATPRISVNMTLVQSVLNTLPDFVGFANDLGVQFINGRKLILIDEVAVHNEMVTDFDKANEIIAEARRKAASCGIECLLPIYTDAEDLSLKGCNGKVPWLYISATGDVSRCPRIHMYESFGNILHESLCSILQGEKIRSFETHFFAKSFQNPVCEICTQNLENKVPIKQGF